MSVNVTTENPNDVHRDAFPPLAGRNRPPSPSYLLGEPGPTATSRRSIAPLRRRWRRLMLSHELELALPQVVLEAGAGYR